MRVLRHLLPAEHASAIDKEVCCVDLDVTSLTRKHGFCDGDILEDVIYWLEDHGGCAQLDVNKYGFEHSLLIVLVEGLFGRYMPDDCFQRVVTNHNPIRYYGAISDPYLRISVAPSLVAAVARAMVQVDDPFSLIQELRSWQDPTQLTVRTLTRM